MFLKIMSFAAGLTAFTITQADIIQLKATSKSFDRVILYNFISAVAIGTAVFL
jgi:hypothetical protein